MVDDVPVPEESSFEQSLESLEQVVSRLERGDLGLEDSLRHYEIGHRALRRCYKLLEDTRRKIEVLTGHPVPGDPPVWSPFNAADLASAPGERASSATALDESEIKGGSR